MTSILGLFGRSPIRPLEQHMRKVHAAAKTLEPFFEAVFHEEWSTASSLQKKISELEREADHMKKEFRLHLPKGLFLPVERSDLLALLDKQDQIANKAKDIAGLVMGRRMTMPASLKTPYLACLKRCLDASHQASVAINELDELLETGFKGQEVRVVEEMIVKLDEIEHDTDTLQHALQHTLFIEEKSFHPIDVIFLYKIIEWTGDLADHAQTVGGRLQLLLAR